MSIKKTLCAGEGKDQLLFGGLKINFQARNKGKKHGGAG